MKSRLISLLLCLLGISVFAQRPQYGKMSPMLRQLARSSSPIAHHPSSIAHHSSPTNHHPSSVCAFVKVGDNGEDVLREHGCKVLARVGQVCIADIPVRQLGALSLDASILRMEARQGNCLLTDQMAIHLNALPVYEGQNLPQAFTGKDVVVGVMDVGFDLTHPNFYSADTTQYRIKKFWDMVTQDTVGSGLYVGRDYEGRENLLALGHSRDGLDLTHGTYTTGIAAGSGVGAPYRGMAPEADLCLVANAVNDDIVYIDSADYYKYTFATDALGFKYLFDYAKSVGKPCVASFSEGSSQDFWGYDQLYYEMLDSLVGPGRILVAAAGNNGALKSWFRKPVGEESAGAFLTNSGPEMLLTFKSAQDFRLRLVAYSDVNDTLLIRMSDVLSQEDSLLMAVLESGDYQLSVTAEAYPSCYDASEMCYDVTLHTTDDIGAQRPLSVEVVGRDADVEYFRVNGQLYTKRLNPSLNAGESICCIHSPSSAPCVISVGSTSYRDSIQNMRGEWKKYWLGHGGVWAPFSSVGPTFDGRIKPDVMAPGNNIISSYSSFYMEAHPQASDLTWDLDRYEFNGRSYAWVSSSGTSASCPAVAGAIALWLQAKPDLTPQEVKEVLSRTCRHYDESLTYPNNTYGYGEIDVYRGLLYILGVDQVKDISQQHTKARVRYANSQIHVVLPKPLSIRVRIYNMSGHLVQTTALDNGQSEYTVPVNSLPAGIYAVQIDGDVSVQGSTLIRR